MQNSSLEKKDFFMALAFLASTRSKDAVTRVGTCIVNGDPPVLLGLGYNGMPDGPGFKDSEMKWFKPDKSRYVCHAEMNAIISACRRQADLSESTLYTTYSPCSECCKLIHQGKIKKVYWANEYDERIEDHMNPIKQSARRLIDGVEKFLAVEQYLVPPFDVKPFKGEKKVLVHLDNVIHCETGSVDSPPTSNTVKERKPGPGQRDVDLSKDDFFMAIAKLAYNQSTGRTKVGACLVTMDPHRVISIGCSEGHLYKPKDDPSYKMEMCAESNAIMSAFRAHADLTSSTLYITSPLCYHCAKITVQSGVKTVIYFPQPNSQRTPGSEEEKDWKAVLEIFYRARIPYLEYQKQTKMNFIEIDLANKTVN